MRTLCAVGCRSTTTQYRQWHSCWQASSDTLSLFSLDLRLFSFCSDTIALFSLALRLFSFYSDTLLLFALGLRLTGI